MKMTGMMRCLSAMAAIGSLPVVAAPILDGPVPDSVPRPPAEPAPEAWRFKADLSRRMSGDYDVRKRHAGETPWLRNRISRCFFGPIKRPPFFRDELNDDIDYYPENYLERLAREGVNGLWLTIEFGDFSKELTGDWPEGAERRLAKLRRTVEKCARHGIRIWLFCIEPVEQDFRRSPLALKHPDWIGCTYDDLMGSMCASQPGVQKYISDTVRDIFAAVPGLGGIINISNGEKVTSCLSICKIRNHPCLTHCPRCTDVPNEELLHRVTRAFVKGIRDAGSDAEFISWIYRSAPAGALPEWIVSAVGTSPDGVIQQNNFETGVIVRQEDRWHVGGDYWLAQPGPSKAFADVAKAAKAGGRRLSAKIQVSCSHEIATIPVLPVPGLLYRKFKGMHDLGVTDAMYCWYFGSAPGLMNRAAGELAYSDFTEGEDAFLMRLASDDWGEDAATMAKVWKACSDGFANYPLSNPMQYYGPFHQGVVWPLRPDVEMRPLGDSWIPGQPAGGDLIGECLMDFDLEEALSLARKMCAEVEKVGTDVAALERKYAGNPERMRDLGLVRALGFHFEAARDIFEFYLLRRDAVILSRRGDTATALRALARMKEIAVREKAVTAAMKDLALGNPLLGFHSEAESYIYTPEYLDWRIPTLDATIARLDGIANEVKAGRGYPLSPLEKVAPVFRARLDARGDLVLEGEAKGHKGDVTAWVWDACGTRPAKAYVAVPKDGRFSLTIPSVDWRGDPRLRPGWIQIHQGCHWRGDSWQWPKHPPFAYRWCQGDRLGYYSARIVVEDPQPSSVPDDGWKMFDRRLGLFVHWGIYSVGGFHEQERMKLNVPRADYEKHAERFAAEKFDADALVAAAKLLGADYIVFTSKHHDGFCMWDTQMTDFKVTNTPCGRDVLRELAEACRRGGIKLGLYYSNPDWHHPNAYNPLSTHQMPPEKGDAPDMEKYRAYVRAQVTELLTNYGEIICFFWDIPARITDPEMNALVRRLQPGIRINDRGWGAKGDYSTPECRIPAGSLFPRPTEACDSVGACCWGYRANEDYRTVGYLTRSIDAILSMGGNYLLNIGPKADGTIPAESLDLLAKTGDWYERVRESYRNVETVTNLVSDTSCFTTVRGKTVYLHYPKGLARRGLDLSPMMRLPKSATLLNTGKALGCELVPMPRSVERLKRSCLHVTGIPADELANESVVIKLEFDGEGAADPVVEKH